MSNADIISKMDAFKTAVIAEGAIVIADSDLFAGELKECLYSLVTETPETITKVMGAEGVRETTPLKEIVPRKE